ncbi:hypothetical protein RC74_18745 [Falsihalocynthiibacter arcticus]|uniref:Uncharacterized protein n=1 Tax=Falsihalocynthiibacter arcticus TaxID=1579316 RepID=A0A126V4Y1_9RHOB|nr:hypothetical protein RC74_18745 [Falsihalocynthiibacter arcticus]
MSFEVPKTEFRVLDRTEKSEAKVHRVSFIDSLRSFSSLRVSNAEIRKKDLKSHPRNLKPST